MAKSRTRSLWAIIGSRCVSPNPFFREITIVDTPGTNWIIETTSDHRELHTQSDLVIFVFPAKNPGTGTPSEIFGAYSE